METGKIDLEKVLKNVLPSFKKKEEKKFFFKRSTNSPIDYQNLKEELFFYFLKNKEKAHFALMLKLFQEKLLFNKNFKLGNLKIDGKASKDLDIDIKNRQNGFYFYSDLNFYNFNFSSCTFYGTYDKNNFFSYFFKDEEHNLNYGCNGFIVEYLKYNLDKTVTIAFPYFEYLLFEKKYDYSKNKENFIKFDLSIQEFIDFLNCILYYSVEDFNSILVNRKQKILENEILKLSKEENKENHSFISKICYFLKNF